MEDYEIKEKFATKGDVDFVFWGLVGVVVFLFFLVAEVKLRVDELEIMVEQLQSLIPPPH